VIYVLQRRANWLLNITAVAGFFSWLFISLAHIRFMKALRYRNISRNDLPIKASLMPGLAYYATFFMILIIILQGFTAFAPQFSTSDFFAAYISIFLFIGLYIAFQLYFRSPILLPLHQLDLDSGRRHLDALIWNPS